jgi:hypothetical protein
MYIDRSAPYHYYLAEAARQLSEGQQWYEQNGYPGLGVAVRRVYVKRDGRMKQIAKFRYRLKPECELPSIKIKAL